MRGGLVWALVLYLLFYVVIVLGSYGWLTQISQRALLPQGASFTYSLTPPGIALRAPAASVNLGDETGPLPLLLDQVHVVWPLFTPWQLVAKATEARLQLKHDSSHDQLTGHTVTLRAGWPTWLSLHAASIDWQTVVHNVTAAGQPTHGGITTLINPQFDYAQGFFGLAGPAEKAVFNVAPIMLPTNQMGNVVQIDRLLIDLSATRKLPRVWSRENAQAWHDAGGQVNLNDFQLEVIDMDIIIAGDVGLTDALALRGNMQLQISGIATGYGRLGQLGIVQPQHYRLLGYVLQTMPEQGARTFTLPVKIDKNKFYIGPAAAFAFPPMPWQTQHPTAQDLLDRPMKLPQVLQQQQQLQPVAPAPAAEMPTEMAVPLGGSKDAYAPKALDGVQDIAPAAQPKAAPSLAPGISSTTPAGVGGRTQMQLPTDASTPGAIEVTPRPQGRPLQGGPSPTR